MNCETKYCHFVKGDFYIGRAKANCFGLAAFGCDESAISYLPMGNIVSATISHQETVNGFINKHHTHFNKKSYSQISDVVLEAQLSVPADFDLSVLLEAKVDTRDPGAPESDVLYFHEFCKARLIRKCTFIDTCKRNVVFNVVTPSDNTGASTGDDLVEGVDYEVKDNGIYFLRDYIVPTGRNTDRLKIEFTHQTIVGVSEITPFQETKQNYSILLKGTNFASENLDSVDVKIFNFWPTISNSFELIQEGNMLTLSLQGRIEPFYDLEDIESFYQIIRG